MSAIPITGLYTGLTIIIAVVLGSGIGMYRGKSKISVGDGGDARAMLLMRRHGNLMEIAALFLVALAIIELGGAPVWLLHTLGIVWVLARIAHPIGLKVDDITHPLRAVGAGFSTLSMLVAGIYAIWQFVQGVM